MKCLMHVFVTLTCITLFSCHGVGQIPQSYFGIYQSHFGETVEISDAGIRISGFDDIGAHDQTLDSSFEGFHEISEGIWNQQPGIYIEPVTTASIWHNPYSYTQYTPEESLRLCFAVSPDSCQKKDSMYDEFTNKVFSVYVVTDMKLQYDEGNYSTPDAYKEMRGEGSVIAFNVDTTVQEPVSQLKVYSRRSPVRSLKGTQPCMSEASPSTYLIDDFPTYFHRVK